MKQILVTGAKGQLGSSIRMISPQYKDFWFTFLDIDDLDLTETEKVTDYLSQNPTDYIINCAAYTAVDMAEKQPETAYRINSGIPELLGKIARTRNIRLFHISTDYVYDGNISLPHLEDEKPAPISVYARSKQEGDNALNNNSNVIILRTSWLYSEFGNNFLTNMLRLGETRKELGVVFDQTGTPTYAGDLAHALLEIILYSEKYAFVPGIFNYSNEGVCTWYDFASEIMKHSRKGCFVRPIRTHEYPLPAQRPAYGVMDKAKIKEIFGIQIPYWRDSLFSVLENLEKNKEI
jgi:dTDP-4-dehydrorhamnose reductase